MKAVVYTRVSTAEQVGNHSLETQQKACAEFCAREGIAVARAESARKRRPASAANISSNMAPPCRA